MPRFKKRPPLLDYPEGVLDEEASRALSNPVVKFNTLLAYGEDGLPRLVGRPVRMDSDPQSVILALIKTFMDCPYDGRDKSLEGLTMGEAMTLQRVRAAANGDSYAFEALMNRLVGEPVKRQQNVTLTGDLGTFLDKVASSTRTTILDVTVPSQAPRNPEDDL